MTLPPQPHRPGRRKLSFATLTVVCALLASTTLRARAEVSADEARQLGTTLTRFGAIAEGNKDGSIPPYTGGLPTAIAPPGFKKGSGFWADPYANDKPLFSITAKNADRYADKLIEGDLELLRRRPEFRMDIYPTRRSVAYPAEVLNHTVKNATRCRTFHAGQAIKGCYGGRPFPIPKTGYEAMWNLLLHYQHPNVTVHGASWYVDSTGRKINTALMKVTVDTPYYYPDGSPEVFEDKYQSAYARSLTAMEGPPRALGEAIFTRYFTNPVDNNDEYWVYQPGLRRARNAPENAYDFPVASIGGSAFYDERVVYAGRMDRFEFKLLGLQERYIPYNTYRLENATPDELLQDHILNPDLVRWELHRVWVVEATLLSGYRHVYSRRRYYIDEDEPGAATTVAWNRQGKIHRMVHASFVQHYDVPAPYAFQFWAHDFASGVYAIHLFPGGGKGIFHSEKILRNSMFTPETLSRISVR